MWIDGAESVRGGGRRWRRRWGGRGVFLFRRVERNEAHFLTLTHWDSLEAIEAFAGADISKAKYYPEDADFLLEFEPTVEHYELYVAPAAGA